MKNKHLTQDRLKEFLTYIPETGLLIKKSMEGRLPVGSVLGCEDRDGYIQLAIDGMYFKAHRLAFLYMEGSIPKYVDHKDRVPSNNVWTNLRPCTHSQNMGNANHIKGVGSKYRGVYYHKGVGKYCATIREGGKKKYLGVFRCEKQAALKYNHEAKRVFGEFATLNIILIENKAKVYPGDNDK